MFLKYKEATMFQVEFELDRIIQEAIELQASDIHFDATAEGLMVRLRIHGSLQIKETIQKGRAEQLINRIKILSGMDIGERRLPQDGRWSWTNDVAPSQMHGIPPSQKHGVAPNQKHGDSSSQKHGGAPSQKHGIAPRQKHGIASQGMQFRVSEAVKSNSSFSDSSLSNSSLSYSSFDKEAHRFSQSYMLRVSSLPSVYGETIVCRIVGNENCYKNLLELGMDEALYESVCDILKRPHGLLLICGPTGSGKTSTLYALLRLLNVVEENVISLENPVEADIPGAIQVQINSKIGYTFPNALRAVLRQDPDTIMVGEIRDTETAELAVQAALTGHRVLATIHTNDAVGVRERLLDMGIPDYLVRATLLGALAQRLVRVKTSEGQGRRAIYEFLKIPSKQVDWQQLEEYVMPTLQESGEALVALGVMTKAELQRVGLN